MPLPHEEQVAPGSDRRAVALGADHNIVVANVDGKDVFGAKFIGLKA